MKAEKIPKAYYGYEYKKLSYSDYVRARENIDNLKEGCRLLFANLFGALCCLLSPEVLSCAIAFGIIFFLFE